MAERFAFVQMEFTHAIGPEPGRYVVLGDERPELIDELDALPPDLDPEDAVGHGGADVIVIQHVGARVSREGLLRRRTRELRTDSEPREVALALVTVVRGREPLDGDREAGELLERCRGSAEMQEEWVTDALIYVNAAIRAYRAAARDPYVIEITAVDPRELRIGFGSGQEVYRGRWTKAFAPPPPRAAGRPRKERLGPTEAVAAVLTRRTAVLDAEDLALRSVLDLEQDQPRRAVIQVRAALDSLLHEVTEGDLSEDARERLAALAQEQPNVDALTDRALRESLDEEDLTREVSLVAEEILDVAAAWRRGALGQL